MKRQTLISLILLYSIMGWILFATIWIEYLNRKANNVLPNYQSLLQSKESGGSGKWRAIQIDEEFWREWEIRDSKGKPSTRALTSEEEIQMHKDIQISHANSSLRSFTGSAGCLQYPLIVLVGILGIKAVIDGRKNILIMIISILPVLICLICAGFAYYRAYVYSHFIGI